MKPYHKIILICILIFSIVVYITKKSIDHAFCKAEDTQIQKITSLDILEKTKAV